MAYAIALAVSDKRAIGRIFHVAEDQVRSEAERIMKVGEVAGWQGKVVAVCKEQLPAEWKLPVNTEQNWVVDTTRIRQELGYKEIVPPDEALLRTIGWQRKHPPQESVEAWLLDYASEDAILRNIKHG